MAAIRGALYFMFLDPPDHLGSNAALGGHYSDAPAFFCFWQHPPFITTSTYISSNTMILTLNIIKDPRYYIRKRIIKNEKKTYVYTFSHLMQCLRKQLFLIAMYFSTFCTELISLMSSPPLNFNFWQCFLYIYCLTMIRIRFEIFNGFGCASFSKISLPDNDNLIPYLV